MRIVALLLSGICVFATSISLTDTVQAGCETVGCFDECHWTAYGYRQCRRRCRVRCWHDAPRYHASPPTHTYASPASDNPAIQPELLLMGTLVVIVAIIALVLNAIKISGRSPTSSAIAEVDRDTAATHEITRIMEEAMRRGDDHINKMRDKHRHGD